MNCEHARRVIGADPGSTSPELEQHLGSCAECLHLREETRALDTQLHRALTLDVGPSPAQVTVATPLRQMGRAAPSTRLRVQPRWAMAAGVLLAAAMGFALWSFYPRTSLAAAVVEHVEGEPRSWASTAVLPSDVTAGVIARAGVRLAPGAPPVIYARTCLFRGHLVPHLVVQSANGPMTVMILEGERVAHPQRFSEAGFSGVLLPAPRGSVAVLVRGPADVERTAAEVMRTLVWSERR